MREIKKKNTSKIIGIIFALFTIISALIGLYFVTNKEKNDKENKEIYDRIKDDVKHSPTDATINEEFIIDWEALKDYNVVAWIKFGEYIDYPVVQGEDNKYYLNHTYNNVYNSGGSIFVSSLNKGDFTDKNTIIYGHNMYSLSMFGVFKDYLNQSKKMPSEIYIYLPDGTKHTYKVFSINQTRYDSIAYQYIFENDKDYKDYQEQMLEGSEYDVGGVVNTDKNMITLSTCSTWGSYQGKRVVILGQEKYIKKIQEPASWYNK